MSKLKTKIKLRLSRNGWIAAGSFAAAALLMTAVLLLLPGASPKPAPETAPTPAATAPATTFTPDDFAYKNGYLTCLTRPCLLGIDVSSHKEAVDWTAVKSAGMEFVMLRLGYRGNDMGGIYEDERFNENYDNARAAGLQVGAYFYSQAISPQEAVEEAQFALSVLGDRPLDMPLVYDWEDSGPDTRIVGMDRDTLTAATLAFCREVEAAGYRPMVYFNPDQARQLLHLEQLTDYPFWLAMYSDEMTFEYEVDMWQYTQTGTVPGIDGDMDVNLYFPK